jgi:hypothetical protein
MLLKDEKAADLAGIVEDIGVQKVSVPSAPDAHSTDEPPEEGIIKKATKESPIQVNLTCWPPASR